MALVVVVVEALVVVALVGMVGIVGLISGGITGGIHIGTQTQPGIGMHPIWVAGVEVVMVTGSCLSGAGVVLVVEGGLVAFSAAPTGDMAVGTTSTAKIHIPQQPL